MASTSARRLAVATLVCSASALAAVPVATPESTARALLLDTLAPALIARGATATVTVAPPDARRAVPACDQWTAFVPPGARLAGRTLVGVRCADGSNWQTFVSAEVRVEAPVWQATRALHAGETLFAADVAPLSMPLTATDLDAALAVSRGGNGAQGRGLASLDGRQPAPLGRVVLRPVAAGRALSAADVRDEGRINAGEAVRVIYAGDNFSVTSEGRAVGPADPGSTIQIRLASGNVVAGTLRADHQVELPR